MMLIAPFDGLPEPGMMLITPFDGLPEPRMMLITSFDGLPEPGRMLIAPSDGLPEPGMMLITPFGKPALTESSANFKALKGVTCAESRQQLPSSDSILCLDQYSVFSLCLH